MRPRLKATALPPATETETGCEITETDDGDDMIVKFIEYLRARMKTVIRLSYLVLGLLIVHYAVFVDKSSAHTR